MKTRFIHLSCVLLLSVPFASIAQTDIEPPFTLQQVGPNVWAALSNPKSERAAGANTGFVIGEDAVVVVDTSASMDPQGHFGNQPAEQLLAAIRKLTKLPIKFVVNTHYHFDHVSANAVFVKAGATVLAHPNVRRWIHSENLNMFGADIKPQQKAFIEALLPPSITYDQALDLYLGSRQIHVLSLPGHTGGDSVVVIPDARIIFTGDLFWKNILPNLTDASTLDWIDTLTVIEKNKDGWTFVPGHGGVGTIEDVGAFRQYLVTLRQLVLDAQVIGKSGEALADVVVKTLNSKYKSWAESADAFNYFAKQNAVDTEAELNRKKRVPQPIKSNP